jgi:acetyl esterase/lipase
VYPFLTAVYRQLLAEFDASTITLAGDSAGGGLALGLAQTLLGTDSPQPRRLVLISPWLDLALSSLDLPPWRG